MQKLISFIIPSRSLTNVKAFLDNIEETVFDPNAVEVLLKFDLDQPELVEFIEIERKKKSFSIKYICTPRIEGMFSLWVGMEQLFFMADPKTYFIQLLSDEPRFQTMHWDKLLRNYVGFFSDDVFRLRLSRMKFSNYATHYECTFHPDSFPIYTRRWLELTEGTGDCWGSDAYHQCVAFQLSLGPGSYLNYYREHAISRDVVVHDITLTGLDFGVGVSAVESKVRQKRNLKEWSRLSSHFMQEHFSYLARRINCYIIANEMKLHTFVLRKNAYRKTVSLVSSDNNDTILELSYAVPRMIVYTQNFLRFLVLYPRRSLVSILDRLKQKKEEGLRIAVIEPKLDLKKNMKQSLMKIIYAIRAPFNLIFNKIDSRLASSPPGVSTLGKGKANIPKYIKKPTDEQVEWLKDELKQREENINKLKHQVFCTNQNE